MQPFSLPERRRVAFTALAFASHENRILYSCPQGGKEINGKLGYIFDLITSRYEKHGVPEISLLDRKSLHFLSLDVPIFCNRERC
jgi:hypothetical protein